MPAKKKTANVAADTSAAVLSPPSTRRRAKEKEQAQPVASSASPIAVDGSPLPTSPQKKGKGRTGTDDSARNSQAIKTLQRNADKNSGRIQAVEVGLRTVNSSIEGLDQKFDNKLDAMMSLLQNALPQARDGLEAQGSDVARADSPPVQPSRATLNRQAHTPVVHASGLPPPTQLRQQENVDGELDRLFSREEYRTNPATGKNHLYSEGQIVKPYMYVEREGIETIKQKLDIRQSITPLEYLSASLRLLHDPSAHRACDRDYILRHLLAVSIDAVTRLWAGVRRWTQTVWDSVEKGWCTWDDTAFIQEERVRISYTGGAPSTAGQPVTQNRNAGTSNNIPSFPCRDFNGLSGCKHPGSHEDNGIRHTHSCAYCDSMGRRSNHSIQRCRSKNDGYNHQNNLYGRHGHDGSSWYNSNSLRQYGNRGNGGGHHRPAQSGSNQGSKND